MSEPSLSSDAQDKKLFGWRGFDVEDVASAVRLLGASISFSLPTIVAPSTHLLCDLCHISCTIAGPECACCSCAAMCWRGIAETFNYRRIAVFHAFGFSVVAPPIQDALACARRYTCPIAVLLPSSGSSGCAAEPLTTYSPVYGLWRAMRVWLGVCYFRSRCLYVWTGFTRVQRVTTPD
jgi:hypothetical protein